MQGGFRKKSEISVWKNETINIRGARAEKAKSYMLQKLKQIAFCSGNSVSISLLVTNFLIIDN